MSPSDLVSISIVSHGQGALIGRLLEDIVRSEFRDAEIIVTLNIPEDEAFLSSYNINLIVLRNTIPKGFGANHNAAFSQTSRPFFAIVNPDIRCGQLDLGMLLVLFEVSDVALVAPRVMNSLGGIEDSFRRDPTVLSLARRVVTGARVPDYALSNAPIDVDWVAGMFMLVRRDAFATVQGFDDRRFFMYFEDADLCRRLRQRGNRILIEPNTVVLHDAQRDSHRSWRHLRWHLTSAVRYLAGI